MSANREARTRVVIRRWGLVLALATTLVIATSASGAEARSASSAVATSAPSIISSSDASWTMQTTSANVMAQLAARSGQMPTGLALAARYPNSQITFGTPQLWRSASSKSFESGLYLLVYPLTSNVFVTTVPTYISGTMQKLLPGSAYAEIFNQNWQLQNTETELLFGAYQSNGTTAATYSVNSRSYQFMYETYGNSIQQEQPQFLNDLAKKSSSPNNGTVACDASSTVQDVFNVIVPGLKYFMSVTLPKPAAVIGELVLEGLKVAIKQWGKSACA